MILTKTRSRNRIPKPPKPKYLKRSRKPIARKARFNACDNKTKTYLAKRSPEEVARYAEACRLERLRNPTLAEDAFAELLRDLGVGYEREKIFYYAENSKFLICDFYIEACSTTVEVDGGVHGQQIVYDRGRDEYLASVGTKTIRFTNAQVLKNPEEVKARIREVMGL